MQIRVVTWNMNRCFRRGQVDDAWSFLDRINADIALLQEVDRPPGNLNYIWHKVWNDGWGTAIVARSGYSLSEIVGAPVGADLPDGHLERSHPGAWVAAEVEVPGSGVITAMSVYGVMRKLRNGVTYATTSVHRSLSDLTPVLDVHRSRAAVVLGGDLNVSPQIDPPDREAHQAVIERIKAFGLTDCLRAKHEGYVQTHRHRNQADGKPWQNDWVFASKKLRLVSCEPLDTEEAWGLSDHCPVIAEFDV